MADRSISITLQARVDGFVSGLRTAQQATTDFSNRTLAFAAANEQHMDRVGKSSMVMGGGILAGIGLAVKSYADFDQAMSNVRASTHETQGNMEQLREAAIEAGADTSFSAKEAANGIDELSKAGIKSKDILAGGLKGALSLAAAGSLGVADAAEIAASAMTQFKLSGDQVPHVADLLAAGAGKAQGSVQDLGMALNQAGLVAASTGLNIEETTGGLAAFASAGMTGSDAGTSFKSMLQRLTPQSKEAQLKMEELGISAYDAKGNFIGLAKFAENLKTSMANLSPEARSAAMGVIFGSDAVRAANVLFEQGGKGITDWTAAVNDSGYAAQTAAMKQDNLRGDVEKLGGSFDSFLIKSGGGANDALRGLVKEAEHLVDWLGKLDSGTLNTTMAIGAITGGALLMGGAFLTALPKIEAARVSLAALSGTKAGAVMAGVGKAAGVAAVAMIGLEVFNAVAMEHRTKSTEDLSNAVIAVSKAGDKAQSSNLDSVFSDYDKLLGKSTVSANGMAEAIARITHPQDNDGINRWADNAFSWTGLAKSETTQIDDRLKALGGTMADLAKNGATKQAADSFNLLSKEFEKNGSNAQDALEHLPEYKEALLGMAHAAGVSLNPTELLELATGKIPDVMKKAAEATDHFSTTSGKVVPVSPEVKKALDDIGLSAQGTVTELDKYAAALVRAGLSSISEADSNRNYMAALDAVDASLAKNGRTLDLHTAAGRENEAALYAVASAGIAQVQSMGQATDAYGQHIHTADDLHAKMITTYDDLVANAAQFVGAGDAADTLARKALGIPKGVDINTYMHDFASGQLDAVGIKADKLNGKKVTLEIFENTWATRYSNTIESVNHVANGPGGHGGTTDYATGGRVYGPGTTTSDSVPANLSRDEYVLTAAAAAKIGYATLDRLNGGDVQPLQPAVAFRPIPVVAAPAASGAGPTTQQFHITGQSDPVATAMETARRFALMAT